MYLKGLKIRNHPILGDIDLSFINKETNKPYSVIAFVGENGCGKTTLLNEIFKYKDSEYIVDKENEFISFSNKKVDCVFIRQNMLYYEAMNNASRMIDGSQPYKTRSANHIGGSNIFNLRSNNKANRLEANPESLNDLGNSKIIETIKEKKINQINCGVVVTEKIMKTNLLNADGMNNFSSGELEMLLKIRELQNAHAMSDWILIDEPEASLHPRWQRIIVSKIQELSRDTSGEFPQLIIATHSEKVLESLIEREDTLIIRLYKDKEGIHNETIDKMNCVLPKTTFAELDCLIFNIYSLEYCSELYDLLEWRTNKHKATALDKIICEDEKFNPKLHTKEWINDLNGDVTKSISTYCRNYFHHPKDKEKPSNQDIKNAIFLLKSVIKNLK